MAFGLSAASAALVGGGLVAGASLLAADNSASAATSAADTQAQAANSSALLQKQAADESIAEQRRQFDTTQANNAPFLQTGTAGNARLAALLGLNGGDGSLLRKFSQADLNADPVYQNGLDFGLSEGEKGINARAIASGGYDSGQTLKALTRFGNDYGTTKANDAYTRYVTDQGNIYNKLAGISGTGQTAVTTAANTGANTANGISSALMGSAGAIGADITGGGNARAAGIVGGANAWGGAAQNINGAINNYNSNQTLMRLLGGGGLGSSYGGANSSAGNYSSFA